MDSSDSEDDCYGNVAQKLHRMKRQYGEDNIESINLLDESSELNVTAKKDVKSVESASKPGSPTKNANESIATDEDGMMSLDVLLAMSSKRVTRSSKRNLIDATAKSVPKKQKKNSTTATPNSTPRSTKKRTSKTKNPQPSSNESEIATTVPEVITLENITGQNNRRTRRSGTRKRGRGASASNTRIYIDNEAQNAPTLPTYSIGNTEEYPDQMEEQQLFSSSVKPISDVVIIEEEDEEMLNENEELSIKVYWQSWEFFKFKIRRFQKLKPIFEYFSKTKNTSNNKLFFTYNDRVLKPDDTPESINYNIVKFIDGGIVNQNMSDLASKDKEGTKNVDKNGIKLKFQCQNHKKPFETTVGLDDKMSLAMIKCAEHFELSLQKIKFKFDGDAISGNNTARSLELEGGECIDVITIL